MGASAVADYHKQLHSLKSDLNVLKATLAINTAMVLAILFKVFS